MKNWITTLIGAVSAATTWIYTFVQNGGNLADWRLWVFPTLIAVFGYFTKDVGKTGTGV